MKRFFPLCLVFLLASCASMMNSHRMKAAQRKMLETRTLQLAGRWDEQKAQWVALPVVRRSPTSSEVTTDHLSTLVVTSSPLWMSDRYQVLGSRFTLYLEKGVVPDPELASAAAAADQRMVELGTFVKTMGDVIASRQTELARHVNERLDAVSHRLGESMQTTTKHTVEIPEDMLVCEVCDRTVFEEESTSYPEAGIDVCDVCVDAEHREMERQFMTAHPFPTDEQIREDQAWFQPGDDEWMAGAAPEGRRDRGATGGTRRCLVPGRRRPRVRRTGGPRGRAGPRPPRAGRHRRGGRSGLGVRGGPRPPRGRGGPGPAARPGLSAAGLRCPGALNSIGSRPNV